MRKKKKKKGTLLSVFYSAFHVTTFLSKQIQPHDSILPIPFCPQLLHFHPSMQHSFYFTDFYAKLGFLSRASLCHFHLFLIDLFFFTIYMLVAFEQSIFYCRFFMEN